MPALPSFSISISSTSTRNCFSLSKTVFLVVLIDVDRDLLDARRNFFESSKCDGERDTRRFLDEDEWRRCRRLVDLEREAECDAGDRDGDRRLLPDDFLRELRCSRSRRREERERRELRETLALRRSSTGCGEPVSARSLILS